MITISTNSCRICLSFCNDDELPMDQFSSMFLKCTGVEVNCKDIPTKICPECLQGLLQVLHFMTRVENTEKVLTSLRDAVEIAPGTELSVNEKPNLISDLIPDVPVADKNINLELLDENFAVEYLEEVNLTENPAHSVETVEVLEDGHYPTPDAIDESYLINSTQTVDSPEKILPPPKTAGRIVRCKFCNIEVRSTSLQRHIKNFHYGIRYQCEHCSRSYTIKENLQVHMKKHHLGKPNKYQCSYCDKTYTNWSGRYYHQIKEHNQNYRHICKLCNKPFLHKAHMDDHVALHHTNRPHRKCPDCDETFFTIDTLTWHKQSCHGDNKRQECKFCEKTFLRKKHLLRHEKTHTNRKEK